MSYYTRYAPLKDRVVFICSGSSGIGADATDGMTGQHALVDAALRSSR